MSGHSKWSTIKRAKEAKDAKRSNAFTKLSKIISVAARDGSDPEMNFKLRMAMDKARAANMPKDNIERAVKKGSGELDGVQIESLIYEVYGPEGVAMIVEVLTDNKNRTVSEIKHILSKHNGNMGSTGSVMWMFDAKGEIVLKKEKISDEEELKLIEAGAEDIVKDGEVKIICAIDDLESVKNKIDEQGFDIKSSDMVYIAKDKVTPEDPDKILKLFDALDDNDDVNNIYANADI